MDDQSFCTHSAETVAGRIPPPRTINASVLCRPCWRNTLLPDCIKLSWCVFILVTLAVNIFAQENKRHSKPMHTAALINEALRYRMVTGTTEVGQITVNIVNKDDALLHIVESVSGLFERTTALLVRKDSTLQPLASHTVMMKESYSQEIQLQYSLGNVSGEVFQPEKLGGRQRVGALLAAKTQDYYIVPYFLRSCALQENEVIKFPVYEALRNQVELARGWVVKLEEIEVPVGKFACYRVEGFTGKLRWILYFDKEFPHRLIKQKFPALRIETELIEVMPNS